MTAGELSDPLTPVDIPWLLPQTSLHAHARRTFCTSVCKPRLTPSNYYYYYDYYYYCYYHYYYYYRASKAG